MIRAHTGISSPGRGIRIALAVVPLVVVAYDLRLTRQYLEPVEYLLAIHGVVLHDLILFVGKLPALEEYGIGHPYLAQVMDRAHDSDYVFLVIGNLQGPAQS